MPQDVAENKIETAVAVGVGLLEVKDNKFRPTEVITNEEAAAAVAKLYGLTPADTSRIHIYYPDLDAANANAGMIMALINAKLLSPNGVIPFNAVQPVDFDWFSKMLIDYTGFGALAPIRNGYARLINETGIGKGVVDRAALTRSEAAVMLYRTLDTRALEISSIYAGNEFDYKQTDETFLESEYHLYKETGRVAQNGYSTIAAPQSDLNKNTVEIEEKGIYKMADELAIPYLGYDIDYLCYQPEGEMGEIIYAAPAEDDFLVTTLNLADVSYSGGVLEHTDENGKIVKYKVKDNAPALLNGVAGGSISLIGQDGVNGSITLIDYDANKSRTFCCSWYMNLLL